MVYISSSIHTHIRTYIHAYFALSLAYILQQALALQFFPATLGDFLSIVSRQLLRYGPALLSTACASQSDGCSTMCASFSHCSETIADFLMKLNPARLPGFKTTFLQALVSSELFRARGGHQLHSTPTYFTSLLCTSLPALYSLHLHLLFVHEC